LEQKRVVDLPQKSVAVELKGQLCNVFFWQNDSISADR